LGNPNDLDFEFPRPGLIDLFNDCSLRRRSRAGLFIQWSCELRLGHHLAWVLRLPRSCRHSWARGLRRTYRYQLTVGMALAAPLDSRLPLLFNRGVDDLRSLLGVLRAHQAQPHLWVLHLRAHRHAGAT